VEYNTEVLAGCWKRRKACL